MNYMTTNEIKDEPKKKREGERRSKDLPYLSDKEIKDIKKQLTDIKDFCYQVVVNLRDQLHNQTKNEGKVKLKDPLTPEQRFEITDTLSKLTPQLVQLTKCLILLGQDPNKGQKDKATNEIDLFKALGMKIPKGSKKKNPKQEMDELEQDEEILKIRVEDEMDDDPFSKYS